MCWLTGTTGRYNINGDCDRTGETVPDREDLGLLVDGKHSTGSLKYNFMAEKVNANLGIINKSILSKMRTFNTIHLQNLYKTLFCTTNNRGTENKLFGQKTTDFGRSQVWVPIWMFKLTKICNFRTCIFQTSGVDNEGLLWCCEGHWHYGQFLLLKK